MALQDLTHALHTWRKRNFGDYVWEDQFIGVTEEVGELGHHLLKQKQGIRGTHGHHEIEAQDAVGDILIYLDGLCQIRGWDMLGIFEDTAHKVMRRDWVRDPVGGVNASPAIQSSIPSDASFDEKSLS